MSNSPLKHTLRNRSTNLIAWFGSYFILLSLHLAENNSKMRLISILWIVSLFFISTVPWSGEIPKFVNYVYLYTISKPYYSKYFLWSVRLTRFYHTLSKQQPFWWIEWFLPLFQSLSHSFIIFIKFQSWYLTLMYHFIST